MNRQNAEALIRSRIPEHAESVISLLRDAGNLRHEPCQDEAIAVGASKLGGNPDVPPDFEWPVRNGRPLSFLIQVSCEQVRSEAPALQFPDSGLISVFYDVENQPWGFDPSDRAGTRIHYFPDSSILSRGATPENLHKDWRVKSASIEVVPAFDLPDGYDTPAQVLGLTEDEAELLSDIREAVLGEAALGHRLFGYPDVIQNPMEDECQLAFHGVNVGDPSGYEGELAQKLLLGAVDWRMWLQIISDDGAGLMWGDMGNLYLWIRSQDLRTNSFDQSWLILQCY